MFSVILFPPSFTVSNRVCIVPSRNGTKQLFQHLLSPLSLSLSLSLFFFFFFFFFFFYLSLFHYIYAIAEFEVNFR